MIDVIKKAIFFFWNPNKLLIRDKNGKIINDIKRIRASRKVKLAIKNGDIVLTGESPRKYVVEKKGKINVRRVKQLKEVE